MTMQTVTLSAVNSRQLDAQIARENKRIQEAGGSPLHIVVGRARSGHKLWYVHEEYGAALKDRLAFHEVVDEVARRFGWAHDGNLNS